LTALTSAAESADATSEAAPAETSSKNDARNPDQGQAAFAGFVIAFVAAALLY
jgi:hypothetical protein